MDSVNHMPPGDRRRYSRVQLNQSASLKVGRWPDQRSFFCVVRDWSDTGACIELDEASLRVGEQASFRLAVKANHAQGSEIQDYSLRGTIVRNGIPRQYGITFSPTIPEQVHQHRVRFRKQIAAIGLVILAAAICWFKSHNLFSFWYSPMLEAYSLLAAAFVLSRAAIALGYRPPKDNGYLPTLSIVIAAKNEEAHIADTIHHCFRSRYPADRMEIIAIDDGSTDGTWAAMKALETQYPTLRNFRFEKNKGKRHGMAYGAEKASGEILVYVDSDSYVEPEGIYRIVQPFIDPSIGAVSGHILAVEEDTNFISKMEGVRYYISHRIMKAAESVFGAVTCCPGAFSAYRRSAVMRVLDAWLGQRFLGTEATFGDDRSLTNYILRTHQVIYHSQARCVTYVPDTWRKFFRQQLRWKKSWARETTVAARLMYRKHPIAALSYYSSILLTVLSPIMAIRSLVYLPYMYSSNCWPYLFGLFLMYTFLCLFYAYFTQSKNWYYGLAFAGLYLCFLCFQNYYAMLTVRRNHWGTR